MSKHLAVTTQSQHPWRATLRSLFAFVIAGAAMSPVIYTAITQQSPEAAGGAAATALLIAGAITRVMALPGVEAMLKRFVPFLAAGSRNDVILDPEVGPITQAAIDEGRNRTEGNTLENPSS